MLACRVRIERITFSFGVAKIKSLVAMNRRAGRKAAPSDSRYRATSQSAAGFLKDFITQGGALEDSRFALGYYRPPLQGFN